MRENNEEKAAPISNIKNWFSEQGWTENPFIFSIKPNLFVGYKNQSEAILSYIAEKHKLVLLTGPTGSGKTTFLQWLTNNLNPSHDRIFISKMPESTDYFMEIFDRYYRRSFFSRLFTKPLKNISTLPEFINKKTKERLVLLCDEIHEAPVEVLEWLRILVDQVDNITVVLSGLPVFESHLKKQLETFEKRVSGKIELLSLTKEDTRDLIKKRIESVAGEDIKPFTEDAINAVFERTGGFPREVIRACNRAVELAVKDHRTTITPNMVTYKEEKAPEPSAEAIFEKLTPKQVEIIDLLKSKPLSPSEIVNSMDLSKYRSKNHALRSINNILRRMANDGYIKRKRKGRAYVYDIAEKLRPLVVEA